MKSKYVYIMAALLLCGCAAQHRPKVSRSEIREAILSRLIERGYQRGLYYMPIEMTNHPCKNCGKPGHIKKTDGYWRKCKPKKKWGDEYETDSEVYYLCYECNRKY
jgi:hypothetical protein